MFITGEQNVFVKKGDSVVLNCTCYAQNSALWKGPNYKYVNHEDTNPLIYSTGLLLNPKLNKSNVDVVGDYGLGICNLKISNFSLDDEGTYDCQYFDVYLSTKTYNVFVKSKY